MSHPLIDQAVDVLGKLVAFKTVPSASNLPLVRWVEAYIALSSTQVCVHGEKASLVATVGPPVEGGIILSGHTDVVDVADQHWQTPPFTLVEKSGRLYARGACDMKGFIACVLAQLPEIKTRPLKRPLHLALSRDEEIGCKGMVDILAMLRAANICAQAAIVGEPTRMRVVAGHKGGSEVRTIFTGSAAHSAMPEAGTSAITAAAQFIGFLAQMGQEMATHPQRDSPFVPPYGIINVGLVRGGTALNIIPGHCEVAWHYRALPGDANTVIDEARRYTEEVLLPIMRRHGHPASVETIVDTIYPGLPVHLDSTAVRLAKTLLAVEDHSVASFGADAGYFHQAGIPAVLVGPGSITQAHKPDEYVEITQLNECLHFLDKVITFCCE